ncbi:type 2 lanthipeptide synthetase LanM family protein [Allokutzneria albata]|uniref:Type 2 lantibiotic biosynthesis protein LanM n=1 Tax=Allokutzneria albata TaxID=211114 RepID=A0A1G9SAW0_ALLAB|nr:type 2 lanthipeptide synthetase LanM family protein [Allokutzneria albata]SDM32643.1 type 2 lantibiotic biosynthesis protein LanM [Allokutzneria albata]
MSSERRWWSGLPLSDRIAGLDQVELSDDERARGEIRLRLLKENKLLGDTDISLDRWHEMGLADADLVTLLGESAESLRARVAQPPWVAVIESAWQRFAASDPGWDLPGAVDIGGLRPFEQDRITNRVFLGWVRPLLLWAEHELTSRVTALVGGADALPPGHGLLAPPVVDVLRTIKRVLVLELNIARIEGRLEGGTPQERFVSFGEQLAGAPGLDLLADYPVLARELVALLGRWVEARAEFTRHLVADLPLLRERFGLDRAALSDLVDVSFGAGDTHNGGRTVAIAVFRGGEKVVYKPRGLAVDEHFGGFLAWLNERGLRYPLKAVAVLDREDHGWAEFVEPRPCADTDELDRFYWRQGAFLAVMLVLRATDFHVENVIAAGEHPAFVDLESMFVVPERSAGTSGYGSASARALSESVLAVGLLPHRVIEFDDSGAHDIDLSGLVGSASASQLTPSPIVWFADSATDEMRVTRQRVPVSATKNRPTIGGSPTDPRDHRTSLLAGFEATYHLLLDARDDLLSDDGPLTAFDGDEVRHILRPTAYYVDLLDESWHPDVLRDGLDRDYLLEAVMSGLPGLHARNALLTGELGQLSESDVPLFVTTTSSVDLHDRAGLVASGVREISGMAAVRSRILGMSQDDLDRQRWCINASLSGLQVGEHGHAHRPVDHAVPLTGIHRELAWEAAIAVGDSLLATALRSERRAAPEWLSLNLVGERYWIVGPSGAGLYSGASGIALFLAELAGVTGESRFRRAAEDVVAEAVVPGLTDLGDRQALIGGFDGLGAAVYLCARLGELWRQDSLLDLAAGIVPHVRDRMAADRFLDVAGGTAGAALAVLALHRIRPSQSTLDTVRHAGEVLRNRALSQATGVGWPSEMGTHHPLVGFSHGASGYAYTLASIAELTGEKSLWELVQAAVRFEWHHVDQETGHWPDRRSLNADGRTMNAWCHGAAGAGLARAALLGMPDAPGRHKLEQQLRVAAERVRRDLVRDGRYTGVGNDSICHGDLGLVETLRAAGQALGEPELTELGARCAAAIAHRVLNGETRCGTSFDVTTPGLMVGTAGIGYGLLRAAHGDGVPNVLLLGGQRPAHDRA